MSIKGNYWEIPGNFQADTPQKGLFFCWMSIETHWFLSVTSFLESWRLASPLKILVRRSTMSRLVFSAWQWELRVSFHRHRIPSQPARPPGRPLGHRDGDDHGLKNSTACKFTYTTWILSGILSGILIAFEEFLVAFKELKDKNMDEFGPGREKKHGNHMKFPRKPRHAQSWNTGARVAMPPWHGAACHFLGFKQLNIKDVGLFNRFIVYWTSNNQKKHIQGPQILTCPL